MKNVLKLSVWIIAAVAFWNLVSWDAGWRGVRTGEYYQFAGTTGDLSQWWNLIVFFGILPTVYAGAIGLCGLIDRFHLPYRRLRIVGR